ncbi:TraC family protein [Microvirga alba]|uniref:Uncharacterized protein n=1 Tax=Microvirga alba TaxID=2791025 RepID=A0A931BQI8_9HYPH|nr:TraC family protein [Microvirga alba]MBF9235617.1 hypothetical protein [Microvirga alba]
MARTASRESLVKQREEAQERHKREMDRIQRQLRQLEDEERLYLGRLCEKAGLMAVEIPEERLLEALTQLADRFRGVYSPSASRPVTEPATQANSQTSTEAAPNAA